MDAIVSVDCGGDARRSRAQDILVRNLYHSTLSIEHIPLIYLEVGQCDAVQQVEYRSSLDGPSASANKDFQSDLSQSQLMEFPRHCHLLAP